MRYPHLNAFRPEVIKSLDVSQDNEIPSHTSEPTLPQHIPPPVGPETQTPPLNTLRQTAHSVIPLLVSMARSVEQDLSQRQRIPPPITHFLQSASSSSRSVLPIANQVSQNIVQNATSSGDIPSQTTTPQAPLDPSDAQILIDVLHEVNNSHQRLTFNSPSFNMLLARTAGPCRPRKPRCQASHNKRFKTSMYRTQQTPPETLSS